MPKLCIVVYSDPHGQSKQTQIGHTSERLHQEQPITCHITLCTEIKGYEKSFYTQCCTNVYFLPHEQSQQIQIGNEKEREETSRGTYQLLQ